MKELIKVEKGSIGGEQVQTVDAHMWILKKKLGEVESAIFNGENI